MIHWLLAVSERGGQLLAQELQIPPGGSESIVSAISLRLPANVILDVGGDGFIVHLALEMPDAN